jgi:hypothetical protein
MQLVNTIKGGKYGEEHQSLEWQCNYDHQKRNLAVKRMSHSMDSPRQEASPTVRYVNIS